MRRGRLFPGGAVSLITLFVTIPLLSYAQSPIDFSWIPAAEIFPARYYHTATLLPDHRLLVTGGRKGHEPLQTVRVFDPSGNNGMGIWIDFPDMADRRERHEATLMTSGWILITGGLDGVPIRQCEFLDPVTGSLRALPDMNDVRYEHTATYLRSGKVLVVGSKDYDRGLPTCEIFESLETVQGADPRWRWRRTGSLAYGRGRHRATKLLDGRVLVTGGVHNYAPTITCELYDQASGQWSHAASMNYPRESHTATLLPDGRVLVTGGDMGGSEISSCEIFDPYKNNGTGEWTLLPNTLYQRKNHTATLVKDRFLILTGAWRIGQGDLSTEILDAWQPNPYWQLGPPMLVERSNHTATLLADGRMILIGGEILGTQDATSQCDITGKTLDAETPPQPVSPVLNSISPNPFSSLTSISFSLSDGTPVHLTIHDMLGRIVKTLTRLSPAAGNYSIPWDGKNDNGVSLPTGQYFCRFQVGEIVMVKPVHLLR